MKKTLFVSLAIAITVAGQSQKKSTTASPKKAATPASSASKVVLHSMVDSASYAIGVSEAKFMKQQGITKINSAMVSKAIEDVMGNKTIAMDDAQCNSAVMGYINKIQQEKSKGAISAGEQFLAENKKKPGVKTTSSGLQYEVIKEGTGVRPTADDSVTCHYAGSLTNGYEFESSYKRGEPITFNLRGVIPGWTEGVQYMTVGSKYKFFIPYQLGYGTQGSGPIPGGSTLIFEIELLDVKKKMP